MIAEQKNAAEKIVEEARQAKEDYRKSHPSMHIKVYSPYKSYFDGDGESISAVNATGPFDILPQHHRFMTLLSPCELVIRTQKRQEKIRISGGLMHVKSDQVTVFLDI
jgi:F0F1-type ATP synthase epsilon subunit